MSFQIIQSALDAHLQTLPGLPPLQLENTRNIGRTDESFSRATLITSRPGQLTVGRDGQDILRGLYQIDLFVPLDTGTARVNELADSVIEHFPRSLILGTAPVLVHINTAWRETGGRTEPFYGAPVVVAWTCVV